MRVLEQFTSWQGTGHLVGTRQHFVRLAGCSVKACPIRAVCDEPGALRADAGHDIDPAEVVAGALAEVGSGGWLHVTGGEPTDQYDDLTRLAIEAQRAGLRLHLQTSGVRAVELPWDWLTVSPKVPAADLEQRFGQELVIVENGQDAEELRELASVGRFFFHYVCPRTVAGVPGVAGAASALAAAASTPETPWGLTLQAHRAWGVR